MDPTGKPVKIVFEGDASGAQTAGQQAERAVDDLKDSTKQAGTATEEFNVRGRAQFLLFSEINRILPGLGTMMHAAFAGPLGPIILVGVAIAEAKKALTDYNAELDKMGTEAAAGHVEAITAVRDAWDNVEEGMAKYFADLQAAAKDKDPTKTLIDNLKKLQEEQFKVEIEQMKLLGRPQAEIDARKDEQGRKTVALLQEERNLRVADLANAQFRIDQDEKSAALADARVTSRKNEFAELNKGAADLETKAEKQRGIIDTAQKGLTPEQIKYGAPTETAILTEQLAKAQSALAGIVAEQQNNARRLKEITDQNQADLTAKAEADQKLHADQAAATSAQTRITELSGPQGEIAQTGLREHVQAAGRAGTEVIEEANTLVKKHQDQFGQLAATFKFYNEHHGRTDDEIAALRIEIERLNALQKAQAQQTLSAS